MSELVTLSVFWKVSARGVVNVATPPTVVGPVNLISPTVPLVVVAESAPVVVKSDAFATLMDSTALSVDEAAPTPDWKLIVLPVTLSGPAFADTVPTAVNAPFAPSPATKPAAPVSVVVPPRTSPVALIFAEAAAKSAKLAVPVPSVCTNAPVSSSGPWNEVASARVTVRLLPATGPIKVTSSSEFTVIFPACEFTCWRKTMSPVALVVVTFSAVVTSTS